MEPHLPDTKWPPEHLPKGHFCMMSIEPCSTVQWSKEFRLLCKWLFFFTYPPKTHYMLRPIFWPYAWLSFLFGFQVSSYLHQPIVVWSRNLMSHYLFPLHNKFSNLVTSHCLLTCWFLNLSSLVLPSVLSMFIFVFLGNWFVWNVSPQVSIPICQNGSHNRHKFYLSCKGRYYFWMLPPVVSLMRVPFMTCCFTYFMYSGHYKYLRLIFKVHDLFNDPPFYFQFASHRFSGCDHRFSFTRRHKHTVLVRCSHTFMKKSLKVISWICN